MEIFAFSRFVIFCNLVLSVVFVDVRQAIVGLQYSVFFFFPLSLFFHVVSFLHIEATVVFLFYI